MIVYSDTRRNSAVRLGGFEFEILNELKDLSSRTDSNCLKHTRFLFEFDDRPLEDQLNMLKNVIGKLCVRAVFSGSKSIHFIAQFSDDCEEMCSKHYRRIWQYLEQKYFMGADGQCKNPSRLTRAPGAFRVDKQRVQELLLDNPTNYIDKAVPELLDQLKMQIRSWNAEDSINKVLDDEKKRKFQNKSHDGMCKEYTTVKRYLDTPFPMVKGNGHSSAWFFAAVCTCIKYKDGQTLDEVCNKARREHWKESEIRHVLSSARSRI